MMGRLLIAALLTCVLSGVAAFANLIQYKTSGGGGAIALVGSQLAHNQNAGAGTTIAATLNGTTAGNFIAVGVEWCDDPSCANNSGTGPISISSSAGSTCVTATGTINDAPTSGFKTQIIYCQNIVGGNDTITVTLNNTPYYIGIGLSEWSGVSKTAADDGVGGTAVNSSTASLGISTGTTTASGELIYSIATGNIPPLSSSQTILNAISGSNKDSYQISGAPGTYTNTWTMTSADKMSGSVAAFKK